MTERPRITINVHTDLGVEAFVDRYGEASVHAYTTLLIRGTDDAGYGQDVTFFIPNNRYAQTAQTLLKAAVELAKLAGGELLFEPHITGIDHDQLFGGDTRVDHDLDECQERVKQASRRE